MNTQPRISAISREALIHQLYEAAELEHNLMCTYLYAAFSLRSGTAEGLSEVEADATARWRRAILRVAVEEMGHLTAVWNITSALGGSPRFGRLNFPLDPGALPANVVVRLEPFGEAVLQHFIYLERPIGSNEPDGAGFTPDFNFTRGIMGPRVTPMPVDYETVGKFYETLSADLSTFVARIGEREAFCGDRNLQISRAEIDFQGCDPVICAKTALAAFDAIVSQGEGATQEKADSHYQRFIGIREELKALKAANPAFAPAYPAAVNPVLRRPVRPGARVWLEDENAATTVDVANSAYMLMLRLVSHSYLIPRPHPLKALCVDLSLGLMRAMAPLGDRAARLPAGPSNPGLQCRHVLHRAARLGADPARQKRRQVLRRTSRRTQCRRAIARCQREWRCARGAGAEDPGRSHAARRTRIRGKPAPNYRARPWQRHRRRPRRRPRATAPTPGGSGIEPGNVAPTPRTVDGVDYIEGRDLTLIYEGRKCIHSRFCVTWGPKVFIANVKGPWINPDTCRPRRSPRSRTCVSRARSATSARTASPMRRRPR